MFVEINNELYLFVSFVAFETQCAQLMHRTSFRFNTIIFLSIIVQDKVNGPITHIISDKKYSSRPIYFNFFMYILYFVFLLIRQAPE